ncbi:MAG TPA: hypothetical protein VIJ72_06730 [Rhizomicrobium sp.]
MSERNEKMAAMLAADAPAARDLAFELTVMDRIERRRFARGMALNLMLGLGAALVLAMLMPGFDVAAQLMAGINRWLTPAVAVALTLPFCWWMVRRTI